MIINIWHTYDVSALMKRFFKHGVGFWAKFVCKQEVVSEVTVNNHLIVRQVTNSSPRDFATQMTMSPK